MSEVFNSLNRCVPRSSATITSTITPLSPQKFILIHCHLTQPTRHPTLTRIDLNNGRNLPSPRRTNLNRPLPRRLLPSPKNPPPPKQHNPPHGKPPPPERPPISKPSIKQHLKNREPLPLRIPQQTRSNNKLHRRRHPRRINR